MVTYNAYGGSHSFLHMVEKRRNGLIFIADFSIQACGFEILVAQAKPTSQGDKKTQNPFDLGGDHGWSQYLNSLKKTGYFKVCCTAEFLFFLSDRTKY